MGPRTLGAVCLGPTGNSQGSHWFMTLNSGAKITRRVWTELPMPARVITRINNIGRSQQMASTITYANRRGEEIVDTIHDYRSKIDDTKIDDSTYATDSSNKDETFEFDDPDDDDITNSSSKPDDEDQDEDIGDDEDQVDINQGAQLNWQPNDDLNPPRDDNGDDVNGTADDDSSTSKSSSKMQSIMSDRTFHFYDEELNETTDSIKITGVDDEENESAEATGVEARPTNNCQFHDDETGGEDDDSTANKLTLSEIFKQAEELDHPIECFLTLFALGISL
eukprot:14240213-Ditylum_brightwellii.AAC.1